MSESPRHSAGQAWWDIPRTTWTRTTSWRRDRYEHHTPRHRALGRIPRCRRFTASRVSAAYSRHLWRL